MCVCVCVCVCMRTLVVEIEHVCDHIFLCPCWNKITRLFNLLSNQDCNMSYCVCCIVH